MFKRWAWGAAALLLALACPLLARADADNGVPVGPTPWVDVQLESGTLTVKTWDRPQVQVTTKGRVDVRHVDAAQTDPRIPRQYTVWSQTVPTEHGNVTMPEESFVLPRLAGTSHDQVVARGAGDTTVMIPRRTALVTADVGTGRFNLRNYKGAFIAHVADGGVSLNRVHGSGYVEALRGPVTASNSTFDRLRARTATGNMIFRGCTSHQIEASSNYGSIVYDNGRFQPGLAHFESVHGNVALGVRGGAQIGARSGAGHIVSSFPNGAQLRGRNSAQATVRGGGPLVTAVSKQGSVYIYNGSVRAHPRVQNELRQAQVLRPGGPSNYPATQYQAPRQYQAPSRQYQAPNRQYPPPPREYQPPRGYAPPPPRESRHGQVQPQTAPPAGGRGGGHGHQPPG
ncbi:MAG TPA: hypothetical protein VGF86_06570 [Candidatus Tumulicola sp.]